METTNKKNLAIDSNGIQYELSDAALRTALRYQAKLDDIEAKKALKSQLENLKPVLKNYPTVKSFTKMLGISFDGADIITLNLNVSLDDIGGKKYFARVDDSRHIHTILKDVKSYYFQTYKVCGFDLPRFENRRRIPTIFFPATFSLLVYDNRVIDCNFHFAFYDSDFVDHCHSLGIYSDFLAAYHSRNHVYYTVKKKQFYLDIVEHYLSRTFKDLFEYLSSTFEDFKELSLTFKCFSDCLHDGVLSQFPSFASCLTFESNDLYKSFYDPSVYERLHIDEKLKAYREEILPAICFVCGNETKGGETHEEEK